MSGKASVHSWWTVVITCAASRPGQFGVVHSDSASPTPPSLALPALPPVPRLASLHLCITSLLQFPGPCSSSSASKHWRLARSAFTHFPSSWWAPRCPPRREGRCLRPTVVPLRSWESLRSCSSAGNSLPSATSLLISPVIISNPLYTLTSSCQKLLPFHGLTHSWKTLVFFILAWFWCHLLCEGFSFFGLVIPFSKLLEHGLFQHTPQDHPLCPFVSLIVDSLLGVGVDMPVAYRRVN